MKTIKEASVTKNVEELKNNEARDEGIKDFFINRDKSNRGSAGLVLDTNNVLGEEVDAKQALYEKSLEVDSFPEHIKPMFSGVFLTARRNKLTHNGLYLPTASFGSGGDTDLDVDFSDTQLVLQTGIHANQVAAGWEVVLNIEQFKRNLTETMAQKLNKEFHYEIPVREIEGVEYIYVTERDISYVSNTNGIALEAKQN